MATYIKHNGGLLTIVKNEMGWFTLNTTRDGKASRLKCLKIRETRVQAEDDLADYVWRHGLKWRQLEWSTGK